MSREKTKLTFQLGPVDIELIKDVRRGGYNVWIVIYPNGYPDKGYYGEIGHHDVSLTFIYGTADDPEYCEHDATLNLDAILKEALEKMCSNDEDLWRVDAEIHLNPSDGPRVIYKAYKERIAGDKWTLWYQDPLYVSFWVSDETGKKMIEMLKRIKEGENDG